MYTTTTQNVLGIEEITDLLTRWRTGDKSAEQRLVDSLYPAMRSIAQREIRKAGYRVSLRATELVHEAYLRLCKTNLDWNDRSHLLAISSHVMRLVLIDLLRIKSAEKRGAGIERITLQPDGPADEVSNDDSIDWLELEQALTTLENRDSIAARVVEMRYFGGMNNDEVACHLGIGVATVVRHWQFARAWLHRRL